MGGVYGSRGAAAALALALAVVAVYANSLSGSFVLDDQAAIVDNATIRDLGDLGTVLASRPDSPVAGRPLPNLTFALNHAIGGLDPTGYHVVNVLLHLACALLAFGIVRRTLALPSVRARFPGAPTPLAFAVALVWALHPLGSEVVDYLTQRTESLMAMFLLATLYAAIRAAGARSSGRWEGLAVAACALGMLSKEAMALAPLLVALYDRVYLYESWGDALRQRRRLYAGLSATWVLFALLVSTGARSATVGFSLGVSPWTYLLNQAQMIVRYLRLAVWPDALVAFYGWPQPLSLGDVLPQALLVVALLGLSVYALLRAPRIGYLGAWFFLLLAPTSSFIPITTEVGAERRMYLPLLALVVLAVLAVRAGVRRVLARTVPDGARRDRVGLGLRTALLAVVCIGLAWGTVARNREYASELTLGRTLLERWPTGVAHHVVGLELLDDAEDEALEHLRQAVALGNSRAAYPLGMEQYRDGEVDAALPHLQAFAATAGRRLTPRWLEPPPRELLPVHTALATIYVERGRWEDAEAQARAALAIDPDRVEARRALADSHFARQRWPQARAAYDRVLQGDPGDVQAQINLGVAHIALGDVAAGREAFERAVEADPRSPDAHRYLAMMLMQLGDADGAARHAREAIALGSDDPILRDILARVSR